MKTILINTAISNYKKGKKYKQYLDIDEIKNIGDENNEEEQYPDNNDSNNEFKTVQNANFTEDELLDTLKTIPQHFSMVFNLHVLEGLKHEKIAKLLNIEVNTSRTRLLRARKLLQKKIYEMSIKKTLKQN